MNRVTEDSQNGQAPAPAKPKAKRAQAKADPRRTALVARPPRRVALCLTIAMGITIPLLSLALSNISGTLARTAHFWLAGSGLALTISVLSVSLTHLAWAIADITRSGLRASWALAITVDLAIVLSEAITVFAPDAGLDALVKVLMTSVCVASMALNVWAFLRHR